MAAAEGWLRPAKDGVELRVRLTPRASRDCIDNPIADANADMWLAVRVRAVPEDGKANAALIALIAKVAGLPKSSIEITAGHTARLKTLRFRCEAERIAQLAERLTAPKS